MANLIVSKHTNMLIIGKGATNYGNKEINYEDDYDEVLSKYGESDISEAFKQAKDFGVEFVFIMNIEKDQDYFNAIDVIKQNDFAYVVFVSLLLSDTFINVYDGGKTHNFFAYILGYIGTHHESVFILTDKHASLYEDIDAYLKDMREVQNTFLNLCSSRANLENVIFVANNLKQYKMANVALAAGLCVNDVNKYPVSELYGEAIFDIDKTDNPENIVYFKNNITRETTVENLLNFYESGYPMKIVFISRILKYIKREIDFSEFKGKLYTPYQKLQYSKRLTECLNSMSGYIIKEYSIDSIEAYKSSNATITLLARIRLVPINCLEICSLQTEVEFG